MMGYPHLLVSGAAAVLDDRKIFSIADQVSSALPLACALVIRGDGALGEFLVLALAVGCLCVRRWMGGRGEGRRRGEADIPWLPSRHG